MNRKIAILRGINVGGKRKILMADLKALFERIGFARVSTYIQSGNVFFNAQDGMDDTTITQQIEQAIQQEFGFDVPVIVRTPEEIKLAIQQNPFFTKDVDTAQLHLTFLSETPSQAHKEKTETYQYAPDQFKIVGANIFVYCEGKYHQSKLTNDFFEKKLKVKATTRNWNTVLKLLELSGK